MQIEGHHHCGAICYRKKEQWTVLERKIVFGHEKYLILFALNTKDNLIFHQVKSLRKQKTDNLEKKKHTHEGGKKLSFVSKDFTQHLGHTPLFLGFGREWVGE